MSFGEEDNLRKRLGYGFVAGHFFFVFFEEGLFGGEGDGGGGALVWRAGEGELALVIFGDDFGDRQS